VARVHYEVAADGDHDQVGLVVLPDQLHVAEESRVAHMVELEPVFELDDEATRLAARIGRALLRDGIDDRDLRRVLRPHLRDRDLRAERVHAAALAEANALLGRDPAEVDHGRDEPCGTEHRRARRGSWAPERLPRALRSARDSATVCALFAPRDAPKGPGKAVEGRRDPVTVIGDETRRRATGREAGKARGVGRSESQETCPGAHQYTGLRGRTRSMASSLFILGGARSGKSRFAV